MTTATMPAGRLAAYDQAVSAYREACRRFAYREGSYDAVRAAESDLRAAGMDREAGLITLPVTAVHFDDVRADGARMAAVNGSLLGGDVWILWSGRALRFGTDAQTYGPADTVQIRGPDWRPPAWP